LESLNHDNRVFVQVVIPVPIEKPYTYAVPPEFQDRIGIGYRVEVQFGKSKRYAALVVGMNREVPSYRTKSILNVIDDQPLISDKYYVFWEWLAEYYCCSIGEIMNAALPANYKLSSETIVYKLNSSPLPDESLSDDAFLLLEALTNRAELNLNQVRELLSINSVLPLIHDLYRRGYIAVLEQLREKYKPQIVKYVVLSPYYTEDGDRIHEALDKTKRSEKQTRAILAYLQLARKAAPVRYKDLTNAADVKGDVVKSLEKKEIFIVSSQEVNRIAVSEEDTPEKIELSEKQKEAYASISEHWETKDVTLLHGATGSGKTWIYKRIIQDNLKQGRQTLFLLPEIALTVQIVQRLISTFGQRVVVAHSGLNNNERADLWRRVQQGAPIVLGVRSSIFLPFANLATVIIDEEHDASYKQNDPAPRYQGRDAAIYLATLWKAKVLLGTATPSVESYYNAKRKKYGLVNLRERYQATQVPVVRFVDLRKKRLAKDSQFSEPLIEIIQETLGRKEQVILFKNRRGYAPIVRCDVCGWQAMCDNCDVALTYHKYKNNMHCHLCGLQKRIPLHCPACAATDIRLEGFGTQKIEDEIEILFPDARVRRMDYDTTRGKQAYQNLIEGFERQEIDILVGTQMVTKGLDFDHVGLVGVIHADQQLYYPHFRAVERTFQLLVQVSGRAGRKDASGNVVIQSYNPTHPVFADVAMNDYISFFQREIFQREHWKYPPYYHLIKIVLKHKSKSVVVEASNILANRLRNKLGKRVLGPAEPGIARVRNQYIMEIGLKVERKGDISSRVKDLIKILIAGIKKQKGMTTVRINVDVDPS
jgi:primosomal protein N' (replication factor Y) (superfamily II helicase)